MAFLPENPGQKETDIGEGRGEAKGCEKQRPLYEQIHSIKNGQ